jgi:hypothetical protein
MKKAQVTVGAIAAASANAICLSQTPVAGPLTLNGASVVDGVAVLDVQRRVLVTTAANESTRTLTITGTNWQGNAISETVTGPNISTVATNTSFKTVTSITISGNAAGAITVGTNGVADSPWVRFDDWAPNYISVNCVATGTVNYTVQTTLDDPNDPSIPVAVGSMAWQNSSVANLVAQTVSRNEGLQYAPMYARVVLNSGTGSVRSVFLQSSNVPL